MAINPLQPPVNYMAMLPQTNIAQGFADLGKALQERKERQQVEEQRQQYATDLQAAINNPTQETWAQMIAKYPKQREAFGDVAKIYGQERLNTEFRQGAQISTALENGAVDIAKSQLETIITGYKNSGKDPGIYQQIYDQIEAGNVKSAQAATNMSLALLDPEKFKKVVEGRSTAAKAPLELQKLDAETIVKEAQAKFAPEKFGLEIDLTKSQIEQAKAARRAQDAAAAKSGAEAARARAEADQMAAGIIQVEKRPEAEGKFRKEYSDQTKGYQEVKSAYGRVLASEDNAVGDLSLIFGYMKMLDPGSVVREGEFATAQNAAGVPERIQNIYNQVVNGQRLSPSQRQSFKGQAGKLYSTAQTQEAQVRQGIERIAKGYGLNTANIFYTPTEVAPTAPGAAPGAPAPAPGAPVSVTAPNGQVLTFPSQQAADAFKKAAGIR